VDATLTQRIADTWAHYVAQAKAHRAGQYPVLDGRSGAEAIAR